jgi:hypothetical protein
MNSPFAKLVAWQHLPLHFFIAAVFCISIAAAFAQSNNSEWMLEQKQVDLGRVDLYVCHDAVKIVNSQWGYQLLAKAPKWTVHCFRPESKTEWIGELTEFGGSMLSNPMAPAARNTERLGAFGAGTINGLNYTRYAPSRQSLAAIYGANEIPVAPQGTEFICRYYNIPDTGKVPLYRYKDKGHGQTKIPTKKALWLNMDYGRDLRGGLLVELLTKSGKKVPFNVTDFEYPHGYKRQRISEVAYSSKQKDTLNDVIDNMGFASDSPVQQKKLPAKPSPPSTGSR